MITTSAYGRANFKLFRNVQNDFDFLIRDIDRQAVSLTGSLIFRMWDDVGNALITKPLIVANPQKGHYRLLITALETTPIRSGIYTWNVTNEANGIEKLLYTNQDYGSQGIIEVSEGISILPSDPIIITPDNMSPLGGQLISSALPGAAKNIQGGANHTFITVGDHYAGKMIVEATVEDQIPNDQNWFTAMEYTWTDLNGQMVLNFYGKYTYVRFRLDNAPGFTKIIYRN